MSGSSTLLAPDPSTFSSSSGRMRGVKSMVISEQPARTRAAASAKPARRRGRRGMGMGSARVEGGNDLGREPGELVEHRLRRAEGTQDELRAAALYVLLDAPRHDLGGAEGGALPDRRLVDAAARDIRAGHGRGGL